MVRNSSPEARFWPNLQLTNTFVDTTKKSTKRLFRRHQRPQRRFFWMRERPRVKIAAKRPKRAVPSAVVGPKYAEKKKEFLLIARIVYNYYEYTNTLYILALYNVLCGSAIAAFFGPRLSFNPHPIHRTDQEPTGRYKKLNFFDYLSLFLCSKRALYFFRSLVTQSFEEEAANLPPLSISLL